MEIGKGGGASTEMWFGNAPIGVKKISTLLGELFGEAIIPQYLCMVSFRSTRTVNLRHLSLDKLTFNMLLYCNSINNNVQ